MARLRLKNILTSILLAAGLAGFLFAGTARSATGSEWLRSLFLEFQAACRDAGTQWMVVACLLSYFIVFVVLERRSKVSSLKSKVASQSEVESRHPSPVTRHLFRIPDFWLGAFVLLVLLRYAFDYPTAAKSLQVVVLLTGIVIGKGIGLWAAWRPAPSLKSEVSSLKSGEASVPSSIIYPLSSSRQRAILSILVLLLAVASRWLAERGTYPLP